MLCSDGRCLPLLSGSFIELRWRRQPVDRESQSKIIPPGESRGPAQHWRLLSVASLLRGCEIGPALVPYYISNPLAYLGSE